jgi:hypothetical protein
MLPEGKVFEAPRAHALGTNFGVASGYFPVFLGEKFRLVPFGLLW